VSPTEAQPQHGAGTTWTDRSSYLAVPKTTASCFPTLRQLIRRVRNWARIGHDVPGRHRRPRHIIRNQTSPEVAYAQKIPHATVSDTAISGKVNTVVITEGDRRPGVFFKNATPNADYVLDMSVALLADVTHITTSLRFP
jgi:hypothetical protein